MPRKVKFLWRLNCYFGRGAFIVKKRQAYKEGRILILDAFISDCEYILINLHNAKKEQIDVLRILFELLEEFDKDPTKELVIAGDFNLFFESKLEAKSGNLTLTKKTLANLIEFKKTCDLWDTKRVRNTKSKRFSFTQKHSSDFIQRRLDYILISNTLQEFVIMTEILALISTDHSPLLLSLSKEKTNIRGKVFW